MANTRKKTPEARLEQACRDLDPVMASQALTEGADPDHETQDDQTPLTILVILHKSGGQALAHKTRIINSLFEAGARKDPHYAPDEGIVSCGLEALIEAALDRLGAEGWDEEGEIALLDAWLEAGNNPNPMVSVDGRIKPLIRSIGYMFDEMKEWSFEDEEAKKEQMSKFIFRVIGVLHVHGCPLTVENLDEAGFLPEESEQILNRASAEAQARTLNNRTDQPANTNSRPPPRI